MIPDYVLDLNDYECKETIGSGQYGKVMLAIHKETKKKFAAKVFKDEIQTAYEQKMFFQELIVNIKAKHKSILSFQGFNLMNFKKKHKPTIITEYVPNKSLDEYLKNNPTLQLSKKYIILLGIAEGMKYLHSQKILHLDLKPENVLLDDNIYPRICDFGFSKVTNNFKLSHEYVKSFRGSYLYMAPEILEGRPYTYKVDIYSFSIIAYELITGKSPFKHPQNLLQFGKQIVNGERPDLSFIEDNEIKGFLSKCWSADTSKRPRFDEIVDQIKSESFKKAMNADESEIKKYYCFLYGDSLPFEHKASATFVQRKRSSSSLKATMSLNSTLPRIVRPFFNDLSSSSEFFLNKKNQSDTLFSDEERKSSARSFIKNDVSEKLDTFDSVGSSRSMVESTAYEVKELSETNSESDEEIKLTELAKHKSDNEINMKESGSESQETKREQKVLLTDYDDRKSISESNSKDSENKDQEKETKGELTKLLSSDDDRKSSSELSSKNSENEDQEKETKGELTEPLSSDDDRKSISESNSKDSENKDQKKETKGEQTESNNEDDIKIISESNSKDESESDTQKTPRHLLWDNKIAPHNKEEASTSETFVADTDSDKYLRDSYGKDKSSGRQRFLNPAMLFPNRYKNESSDPFMNNSDSDDSKSSNEIEASTLEDEEKKTFDFFLKEAENDDPSALFNLGLMYSKGQGTNMDKTKAADYYLKASEKGNEKAQFNLGCMYFKGDGVQEDKQRAAELFESSASKGNDRAQFILACMYEKGDFFEQDYNKAFDLYKKSAAQNNSDAQLNLGYMYDKGYGVPVNKARAAELYTRSAENGNKKAQINLALMYHGGENGAVKKDLKKALDLYTMSADNKDLLQVQFNLGVLYLEGEEDLPANKEKAAELFKKAADAGCTEAQVNLGVMYYNGEGFPKSIKNEAYNIFKKASEQENPKAMFNIGVMCRKRKGEEKFQQKAVKYFQAAKALYKKMGEKIPSSKHFLTYGPIFEKVEEDIEINEYNTFMPAYDTEFSNDDDSSLILAVMFEKGRAGLKKDKEKALENYKQAAENGNAKAQFKLGLMYQNGDGCEIDIIKAKKYYELAANQGNEAAKEKLSSIDIDDDIDDIDNPEIKMLINNAYQGKVESMYQLACMYQKEGKMTQAINWYSKAAFHENVEAQLKLGEIYMNDAEENDDHFYKAEILLNEAASNNCKKAIDYLDELYKKRGIQEKMDFQDDFITDEIEQSESFEERKIELEERRKKIEQNELIKKKKIELEEKRKEIENKIKSEFVLKQLSLDEVREIPPVLMKSRLAFGIDFGTSMTRFGVYKDNKLDERIVDFKFPSIVAFSKRTGEQFYGKASDSSDELSDDLVVVPSIKRILAKEVSEDFAKTLPFELVTREKKTVISSVRVLKISNERTLTLEQVASLILSEAKRIIDEQLKENVVDAVICVPGFFSNNQKSAIKNAAQIAGINVLRLVFETTAIVTVINANKGAHFKEISDSSSSFDEKAVIVEFGAGNLTTSIVDFTDKDAITIKETAGSTSIGGIDIDRALAELALSKISSKEAKLISESRVAMKNLQLACERYKMKEASSISVKNIIDGFDLDVKLTDQEFNSALDHFTSQLSSFLKDLLKRGASKNHSEINQVIFSGGVTKMPIIRQTVIDILSNGSPLQVVDLDERSVMFGASIQAAFLKGYDTISLVKIVNTSYMSIGLTTADHSSIKLIPRGTPYPCEHSTLTTTSKDNQSNVMFNIVEGESELESENIKVGEAFIKEIKLAPRRVLDIEISMSLDEEGMLGVKARYKSTDTALKAKIVSAGLSKEKVTKMKEEANKRRQFEKYRRVQNKARMRILEMLGEMEKSRDRRILDLAGEVCDWMKENGDALPHEYNKKYNEVKNEIEAFGKSDIDA